MLGSILPRLASPAAFTLTKRWALRWKLLESPSHGRCLPGPPSPELYCSMDGRAASMQLPSYFKGFAWNFSRNLAFASRVNFDERTLRWYASPRLVGAWMAADKRPCSFSLLLQVRGLVRWMSNTLVQPPSPRLTGAWMTADKRPCSSCEFPSPSYCRWEVQKGGWAVCQSGRGPQVARSRGGGSYSRLSANAGREKQNGIQPRGTVNTHVQCALTYNTHPNF